MNFVIFIFTGCLVIITIGWVVFLEKYIPLLIPIVFVFAFGTIMVSIKYTGFAVDSSYIQDGTEAVVLWQGENDPYIYYTLLFKGSSQPRLVKFPATEKNKEESKKQKENETTVIRFGKKVTGGNSNSNAGEESEFSMIPFSESNLGKK